MIKLFSVEALRTGWSVWWRAVIPFAGAMLLVLIVNLAMIFSKNEGGVPLPIPVAIGLLNVWLVFLYDQSSKRVARRFYRVDLQRFVGWNVFWRTWLVTIGLGIPVVLVFGLVLLLSKRALGLPVDSATGLDFAVEVIGILVRVALSIMVCGWAFGRVLKAHGQRSLPSEIGVVS